jgi:hypothetical protein
MKDAAESLPTDLVAAHAMILAERHARLTAEANAVVAKAEVRRDNQDGNPATIRMRMRRCWGDEGRA